MNNQEEKEQLFALYYGQKVYMNHPNCTNPSNYFMKQSTKAGDYLLLKPLHAITDSDAIEVAKLMYPKDKHNESDSLKWGVEIAMEILQGQTDKDVIWFAGILPVIDYLRSKSYALPFRGISVEEQISRGYIKLKE